MTTRGTISLGANRYGKAGIRVVTVDRTPGHHTVRDLTVQIGLEGAFEAAHIGDDNSQVVATDTMKNTCYALARDHVGDAAESYGLALAEHFLSVPQVSRATASIAEHRWSRIVSGGAPSDHAFFRAGDFTRTAAITASADGLTVKAGVDGLSVLKTTRSAFVGFPRDRFTTLPDADDRILATKITAIWRYGRSDIDFDAVHEGVVATLLDVFNDHFSPSVQNSAWGMGKAVLAQHEEVEEISLSLPNLHHWMADLTAFGLENDKEVYVATAEPYGLIEVSVNRT